MIPCFRFPSLPFFQKERDLTTLPSVGEEPAAPLRTRAVAVDLLCLQSADDGDIWTRTTVGGVAIHIRTSTHAAAAAS